MNENAVIMFCLQICIMLAAALLGRKVTDKLKLPSVIGELIGGIILGPTILGACFPAYYSFIFAPDSTATIGKDSIVRLGQLFFLFTVGLELNLSFLRAQKLKIFSISTFGIVVPFALGWGAVLLLPGLWGVQSSGRAALAMFVGVALSISALPVIARMLMDLGILKTKLGTIILSSATINDLCGWVLFSIVLSSFSTRQATYKNPWITMGLVLGLIALLAVVYYILRHSRLTKTKRLFSNSNDYIGILSISFIFASAITEAIGIHAVFGAFLIGAVFSVKANTSDHIFDVISRFTNSFFVPIYFVSIGLKANFIASFDFTLVLAVTLIACIGKITGVLIGTRICNMSMRDSLLIAFAMNSRGAMEMILAAIAYEYNIIDQRVFVALISMAIITILISGPVMQRLLPVKAKDNKSVAVIYENPAQAAK